jgi:hypothetical protein
MKDAMLIKGKNYIIHLLQKYKPNFLEKLVLTGFELDKCYQTSILNLRADKREPILHAYSVFKDKDISLAKYINAYKYMSNDGDVIELMALHDKVLKWACEVAFDENTTYGKRNLFLYEKFSNPDETDESINKEIEYIRKVNKQEINNYMDVFYALDVFQPGKMFKQLLFTKGETDDIMKNQYIIGLPATIFLMVLCVIFIVIAVLFYKYTKPIYARAREIFIIGVYGVASIVDSSISPKYIITDLLNNVRNQVFNPRPIPSIK